MTTPPPLSSSPYFAQPDQPTGKPLDRAALLIIAASIAVVGAGLALRGVASQQALNQTIQAMVKVGDQIWIGLPDELIQLNSDTNSLTRLSYKQMKLPSPVIYAVKARHNNWLQLFSGQVWRCSQSGLDFQQVTALGDGEDHYYNIAVLPANNQIVAVNNFSAQIMTLDADNGQIISPKITYATPPSRSDALKKDVIMKTAGGLDGWREGMLYRPNRLHVMNGMLVQTDTGNKRIIGWPLDAEGNPQWQSPVNILGHTRNQTYDIAQINRDNPKDNRWLVLESGSMLKFGTLMSYPDNTPDIHAVANNDNTVHPTSPQQSLALGLADPTLLMQYDAHSILVADRLQSKILKVDYSPYSDAPPGIMNYEAAGLHEPLKALKQQRDFYRLLAKLALSFFFAPLIGILILYRRGYDLNQKLGKG